MLVVRPILAVAACTCLNQLAVVKPVKQMNLIVFQIITQLTEPSMDAFSTLLPHHAQSYSPFLSPLRGPPVRV